jgi:CRISPR-associated protein Csd1
LRLSIDREGEPSPDVNIALLRRAIEGRERPLGYRVLAAALSRLRVSGANRLEPARMGLIRLTLNDILRGRGEEWIMTENLDEGQKHPAYLCGRLLAVYESLQYTVSGETKVNQTVADRYYTLASTYPMLAFPKLEDLGNKHLRKARRDNYGAMVRISREIDELHCEIERASGYQFPRALDPEGQGRFALGYHHQRAHQMGQAQAAKATKRQAELQEQENL